MACPYQHWILPYLDGELEADQREQLEMHVKECADCAKDMRAHKKLQQLLESLDTVAGVDERLANDPRWRQAFRVRKPHPEWDIKRKGKSSDKEKSESS